MIIYFLLDTFLLYSASECQRVDCWTMSTSCATLRHTSSATHHVVPQAFGQLFVPLYGEVEAVVSEEGHIDFPVLLGDTKHSQLTECDLSKASSGSCRARQLRESLVSAWRFAAIHLPTWHRCDVAYRQAWRVSLLQEGLKHHGEVFLEEAVAVQELLQSSLATEKNNWSTHLSVG